MGERFWFAPTGFENSDEPCLCRDDPDGGDPHVLATFRRVHSPGAISELCATANNAMVAGEGIPAGWVVETENGGLPSVSLQTDRHWFSWAPSVSSFGAPTPTPELERQAHAIRQALDSLAKQEG